MKKRPIFSHCFMVNLILLVLLFGCSSENTDKLLDTENLKIAIPYYTVLSEKSLNCQAINDLASFTSMPYSKEPVQKLNNNIYTLKKAIN